MIETALTLLRDELISFIESKNNTAISGDDVVLDNIGFFEASKETDPLDNKIIITLVNIEEESTLKNQSVLKRPFASNAIYQNPPVYLNLYVLFTCTYAGSKYKDSALVALSYIIAFVQSKNSFSTSSSTSPVKDADLTQDDILNLKFTLELYTLTFEQINHLWGSLGGRQMPFAMYKLRLVAITERAVIREVPLIEEIDIDINTTS
jgi:hypothetical protein